MKIKQEEEVFAPITLVLETEYEAKIFHAIFGFIIAGGKAREVTDEVYDTLSNLNVDGSDEYLDGRIELRERL